MSLFDLLIMGFFFLVVLLSFMSGFAKVFSLLIGLYAGAVVAAASYLALTEVVLARLFPELATYTGQLVAFLLVLLVVTISATIALARNWVLVRLANRLGVLNNLAGGVAGIVLAFIVTVIGGMGMTVMLYLINATQDVTASPTLSDVQVLLSDSALVPIFARLVPVVVAPLTPWFPGGMPSILVSGS